MPELTVLELRAGPALARFAGAADLADALSAQVVAVADWLAWCAATQTDPTAESLLAFARQTDARLTATPYGGEALAAQVRHRLVLVPEPIGRSGWPGMHLTGYTRDPDEPRLWEPVLYAPNPVEVARAAARICRRAAIALHQADTRRRRRTPGRLAARQGGRARMGLPPVRVPGPGD
jgi:enoyl-CoA hydratase/carnithine racemase